MCTKVNLQGSNSRENVYLPVEEAAEWMSFGLLALIWRLLPFPKLGDFVHNSVTCKYVNYNTAWFSAYSIEPKLVS